MNAMNSRIGRSARLMRSRTPTPKGRLALVETRLKFSLSAAALRDISARPIQPGSRNARAWLNRGRPAGQMSFDRRAGDRQYAQNHELGKDVSDQIQR